MRWADGFTDHPAVGITPQRVIDAFRMAERGYPALQCDLIDDMVEGDGTARNLFDQRRRSVSGKTWVVQAGEPGAPAAQASAAMLFALRRLEMVTALGHLLDFNKYGWANLEIDWDVMTIDGRPWVVPVWFTPVAARRFRITQPNLLVNTPADQLRLYAAAERPLGDELAAGKWITVVSDGTSLARAGLGRTACWYMMGKRLGFRDWIILSEKFGLPLATAEYDPDSDPEAITIAEEIIRNIGNDGGAVVPKGIDVKIHEISGDARAPMQAGLIAYCNSELGKLINGSTLANDNAGSGGASYALGAVHDGVRWDNVIYDAERVQEAFRSQLGAAFVRFNGLTCAPPMLKIQVVRDLDPKQRTDIAVKLVNELGVPVSIGQMQQELGFREPDGPTDIAPGLKVVNFPTGAGGAP